MSSPESPNGRQETSTPEGGILAALPRARPQRASPRRAAARSKASRVETVASAAKPTATQAKSAKTTQAKSAKTPPSAKLTPNAKLSTKAKRAHPKPAEPPTPKQGYEPEEEVELGSTINPPSGVELVESVADIVGELANSGLAAGGRLLKDAFSLLRP
jgi:hypothetical protein